MGILKNHTELKAMQDAGQIVDQVLSALMNACQPGVSTIELENLANRLLAQARSTAPFKNYNGFGHAICVSLNQEVVNGPPSRERILKSGDLVSIATAAEQRGLYAKAARTIYIGQPVPEDIQRLIVGTQSTITQVVKLSHSVETLNELLKIIPRVAQQYDLAVLENLGGAAIGKKLHEAPAIPNMPELLEEVICLKPGFAFVLMPMFSLGKTTDVVTHEDGWTYLTQDEALSAHFADTLLMTEQGLINLTSASTDTSG